MPETPLKTVFRRRTYFRCIADCAYNLTHRGWRVARETAASVSRGNCRSRRIRAAGMLLAAETRKCSDETHCLVAR